MKRILCLAIICALFSLPTVEAGDSELFLSAFTEAATAYLNDCFLLLGTTADGLVAEILPKETALEYTKNVQKKDTRNSGQTQSSFPETHNRSRQTTYTSSR